MFIALVGLLLVAALAGLGLAREDEARLRAMRRRKLLEMEGLEPV